MNQHHLSVAVEAAKAGAEQPTEGAAAKGESLSEADVNAVLSQ